MIELSVNAAELLVNATEFRFFERLLFLSNAIWLNFSEFNRFFLKIHGINHLRIFCFARIFKHWSLLAFTYCYFIL
jgi:hypothetical protein